MKSEQIVLPKEIIDLILKKTCISCWVCKRNLKLDFYRKLDKNFYCSIECFNHI